MKKAAIIALVCLNVGLLTWVLQTSLTPAHGQTLRGASGYLLLTGHVRNGDAVYVVDLRTRRLSAWMYDQRAKNLVQFRGRDLVTDFKKRGR